MISILFATIVIGFTTPIDLFYEEYKQKETPMAINRQDKRSKYFAEKVKSWNQDHGVVV